MDEKKLFFLRLPQVYRKMQSHDKGSDVATQESPAEVGGALDGVICRTLCPGYPRGSTGHRSRRSAGLVHPRC